MNTSIPVKHLTENATYIEPSIACPHCKGSASATQFRPIDRLFSLFVPIRRYQCANTGGSTCGWQGNLRISRSRRAKVFYPLFGGVKAKKHWFYRQRRKILRSIDRFKAIRVSNTPSIYEKPVNSFGDLSFEDMAQITLDAIGDAVLVVNPQGKVIYLNKVAESLTGWSSEKAIGCAVEEVFCIIEGATRQRAMSPSQQAIIEGRIVELALGSVLIRRDGSDMAIEDSAAPIHNRSGKIAGAVIVFHDARQSISVIREMSHLAYHDSLTGLPNRMLLKERLTQAMGMADRHHKQVALLFLDLDHFKLINDSLGHGVGDQLLRHIAADITTCLRSTDTLSRLGGDEFVVLLTEIAKPQDAALIADEIVKKFALPRIIHSVEFKITLSIGISVYPEDGVDADTLMRHADKAMYSAKSAGRNNYQFFQIEKIPAYATLHSNE